MARYNKWTTSDVEYLVNYVEKSEHSNYDEAVKHLGRTKRTIKQKVYELKQNGTIKEGRIKARVTDKDRVFLNKHFYKYTLTQLAFHMDLPEWLIAKTANEMGLYKYETEKTKRKKIKPKRMKDNERKPKFLLKVGETYTIEVKAERKIVGEDNTYSAKLIEVYPYLAVFDNGKYKICEVISNYGVDWKVKKEKK